jgi:hypothetical protein
MVRFSLSRTFFFVVFFFSSYSHESKAFFFFFFTLMSPQESCFLKLPNEILEYIIHVSSIIHNEQEHQFFGWSYPEHSYNHLKSIALCCRRLYVLCAPFLWKDKEFILPREDDEKSENASIQMATDILSRKALFQHDHHLGDYVRSLSRDLTNGPHYDLQNSRLMAQLVCNLRALRIDFHPTFRTEQYGLRYFAEYCPHLCELYLSHCRDTFDDFKSLCEFNKSLISLTLTDCTIKENTLNSMCRILKPSLQHLLLQRVLIEPQSAQKSNSHLMNTTQFIHPFHFQDIKATPIPQNTYIELIQNQNLTQLCLSDAISFAVLKIMVRDSPFLEKLTIILDEINPFLVTLSLAKIAELSHLTVLSLSFQRYFPLPRSFERLPCHAPTQAWSDLACSLPNLRFLYVSAARVLASSLFFKNLIDHHTLLSYIVIHNIGLVSQSRTEKLLALTEEKQEYQEEKVRNIYWEESRAVTYSISEWSSNETTCSSADAYLCTFKEAKATGLGCFDESDQVCYIKGYS